eukprot:102739-Rhodomonas_salina.1
MLAMDMSDSEGAPSLSSSTSSSAVSDTSSEELARHQQEEMQLEDEESEDDYDDSFYELLLAGVRMYPGTPGHITASYRRQSTVLENIVENMLEWEFEQSFRMNITAMQALYAVIATHLHWDKEMAIRSCGTVIDPRVRMAMALRWLAGG